MSGHSRVPWKFELTNKEHGEGHIYTGESLEGADSHIALISGGLGCVLEDNRCYESEANGEFIVRAVNAHEGLLTHLEQLLSMTEPVLDAMPAEDRRDWQRISAAVADIRDLTK